MRKVIEKGFLSKKLLRNDLVLVSVTESVGPQLIRARIEKIYSSGKAISNNDLGKVIEFVHGPPHWGQVALTVGNRALLFLSSISGQLYEDAWNGHLLLECIGDDEYTIYRKKELWTDKEIPDEIRSASIRYPMRSNATAIRFEQFNHYIKNLVKALG